MAKRTAVCPYCGRNLTLTNGGLFRSHRLDSARGGRGPYCEGSGLTPADKADVPSRPVPHSLTDAFAAIEAERVAFLGALITETRNTVAGPFKRHAPKPGDCIALSSHPFVLVITEDGTPRWTYQTLSERGAGCAYHTSAAPVAYLTAEQVAERRDWLGRSATAIKRELSHPGAIVGEVWARDTLRAFDEANRGWADRLRASAEG